MLGNGPFARWAAVVVNRDSAVFLDPCLRALFGCDAPPAEVVVVDNASTDDSLRELTAWPQVDVRSSTTNLGYAGGANLGIAATEAPLILVLIPEIEVDPGFGSALQRVFGSMPRLGAAGAKLRTPETERVQHAGGVVEYPLMTTRDRGGGESDRGQWDTPAAVDFVGGGVIALRRAAFDAVDGFDEDFSSAYYADVDLCFRLRAAGWQVRYEPPLTATRYHGTTLERSVSDFRAFHRGRLRFVLKHLSRDAWWNQFVPAEVERLRGELSVIGDSTWPARSGAEAIAALARTGRLLGAEPQLINGEPLAATLATLDELRQRQAIRPKQPGEQPSIRDRFRSRRRPADIDDWFERQQAFNDAVVQAFQVQDRLNREIIAELLLAMLELGARP